PDCFRIFDFEGAAPSCSTVHFGLPWPVLVAVQPFGAAPTASASKLTAPSAMTRASIKQRSAAVIKTVFIETTHSVNIVSLEISSAREQTRKLILPRLISEQRPSVCQLFFLARFHTDIVLGLARLSGTILVTGLLLFTALLTALRLFSLGRGRDAA